MKKIIGILGVAVIAATMFFSANNVNGSSSDASLASLVGMNSANAEVVTGEAGCHYYCINAYGYNCYITYYPSGTVQECPSARVYRIQG